MGEYGVRVGDVVQIWNNDDPANPYYTGKSEPWWQNQGLPNPAPGNTSNGLSGVQVAGGIGQLDPYNQALGIEYQNRRLDQYDIPSLRTQQQLADWQRQLQSMGQTGWYTPGGGTGAMTSDQALDAIWQKRPDLRDFFASNGWGNLDDPAQRRKAVQEWLKFSPEVSSAGGDPVKAAQALGIEGAGGSGIGAGYAGQAGAIPTFDREKYNEDIRRYGLEYAEKQRQFDTGTRLNYNQLLATMQGPRNYRRYEAMLPEVFGAVTGGPSWEQAGTEFARSGRTEPSREQLASWYGQGGEAGGPGANPEYRNPSNYAAMGSGQLAQGGQFTMPSEADRARQNADYERRLAAAKPGEFVLESAMVPGGQAGLQGWRLDGAASQGFTESPASGTRGAMNSGWETNAQKQSRQQAQAQPQFRQPTSFKADELATMSPTRRAMEESDWSYEGLDPQDMWAQVQRAQPTGTAAQNTRWRF